MYYRVIDINLEQVSLIEAIRFETLPFVLDSGNGASKLGRYTIAGANPFCTLSSEGASLRNNHVDPFDLLEYELNKWRCDFNERPQALPEDFPPFGGAVGFLGYDLRHYIEKLPRLALDDVNIPDMKMSFYDGFIIVDHVEEKLYITDAGVNPGFEARLDFYEALILKVQQSEEAECNTASNEAYTVNMHPDYYLDSIQKIKDYICSGDIYQVNMTQRFSTAYKGSPVDLYKNLSRTNPAPFGAFLDYGDFQVISSSPERFLRIRKNQIETRPIKGTRPRSNDPIVDESNRLSLEHSEKDRSELLMIVDLERNDLGRVAITGTVKVPELFSIETYPTVYHLVSSVTATLKPDISPVKCVKMAFPGGSITGAPKIRAMQVIDELEPTTRGIYTGSIGYFGFDGQVDLNIVIRTIVLKNQTAYFQTGGGIVWDSDAHKEYDETFHKAKALMRVLGIDTQFISDRL